MLKFVTRYDLMFSLAFFVLVGDGSACMLLARALPATCANDMATAWPHLHLARALVASVAVAGL